MNGTSGRAYNFGTMGSTYRPCPLCTMERRVPITRYAAHHLVRCVDCTMVYSGVLPSQDELDELYRHYPMHESLHPVTRLRYKELIKLFSAYQEKGDLLDAGSGNGSFLDVAKEHGWNVHGSEYDPDVVQRCRSRGITMWQGPLDHTSFPDGNFDVITSFEVLEHLMDPLGELHNFRRMLRSGGLLYLTTPNFNSMSRLLAGDAWSIINYPEHLNYFTSRTLSDILRRSGFRIVTMKATGISPSRLISSRSSDVIEANTDPENADQRLRRRIEANSFLKFAKGSVNSLLTSFRLGDSLKVLATTV